MSGKVVIVGSGAGASTAAMVFTEAGWDAVILERGPSYYDNLSGPGPYRTTFSNDELKEGRYFELPDPASEPRTFRKSASDTQPFVGSVNPLPTVVGGGTVHWDAKTPRFWDIDFKKLSLLGPFPGADVSDWPFEYAELAPHYTTIERLIGVQGSQAVLPATPTLAHAPGERGFVMPPGPQQHGSTVMAGGCSAYGLHPYAFPMAINSQTFDGRPACNDCGFCSSYGCPIAARLGALAPLRRALVTGRVDLRPLTLAYQVVFNGRRATGVRWVDAQGRRGTESGDVVVVGASAPETSRLALLSEVPDPYDRIGRDFMWHNFIDGFAVFLRERMHAYRGRSTTQCCEDFADPDFKSPGGGASARDFAKANGIPYFRAGIMELGGSQDPIAEAEVYQFLLSTLHAADPTSVVKPFGAAFKQLMRSSILRDRLAGVSLVGEDLPYANNRVDLDPKVRDYRGFPVARITYSQGTHEQVAQNYYIPHLTALLRLAGADATAAVPESLGAGSPVSHGAHIMGGMRMGDDPRTSVTDAWGVVHGFDNFLVADGSVFPSSGGGNPTLTIMATALRNALHLAGEPGALPAPHAPPPAGAKPTGRLPATGGDETAAGLGATAAAAALAARHALRNAAETA